MEMVTSLKPCIRGACPSESFQDTYIDPESSLLKENAAHRPSCSEKEGLVPLAVQEGLADISKLAVTLVCGMCCSG